MAKETHHLTIRLTDKRMAKLERLRKYLREERPDEGERIHGVLTTAQILDWSLDALLDKCAEHVMLKS